MSRVITLLIAQIPETQDSFIKFCDCRFQAARDNGDHGPFKIQMTPETAQMFPYRMPSFVEIVYPTEIAYAEGRGG